MSGFVVTVPEDGTFLSPGTAHATFSGPQLPNSADVETPPAPVATALSFSTPPDVCQVGVASSEGRVAVNGRLLSPVTVSLALAGISGSITPSSFEISEGTNEFTYTVTATTAGTGTVTASASGLTSAQHSIVSSGSAPTYVDLPRILFEFDPSTPFGSASAKSTGTGFAYGSSNKVMNIYGNLETDKQGAVNCDVTGRAPTACPLASPVKGSQGFDADEIFFNTTGDATGQSYATIKRLAAGAGGNPTGVACYQFEIDKVKHGWTASNRKNRTQLKQVWGTVSNGLASPWGTEFWNAVMFWLPSDLQYVSFGWFLLQEFHASDSGGLSAGGGLGYDLANNGALGMKLKKKLEVYTGSWPNNPTKGGVSPVAGYPKTLTTLPFNKKCWLITNYRENPGVSDPNLGAVYGKTGPYEGFCDTYLAIDNGAAVLLDRWPADGGRDGKWCSPYAPTHSLVKTGNLTTSVEPGASSTNGGTRLRPTQYPDIGIYCINSWPNPSVQTMKVYFGKMIQLRTVDQPDDFGVQDVLYKIRGS